MGLRVDVGIYKTLSTCVRVSVFVYMYIPRINLCPEELQIAVY